MGIFQVKKDDEDWEGAELYFTQTHDSAARDSALRIDESYGNLREFVINVRNVADGEVKNFDVTKPYLIEEIK